MGVLNDIRTLVRDHLEADAFFAGIDIIEESRGDIATAIDTAMQSLGLCIVLVTPVAGKTSQKIPYGHLDRIITIARCYKNTLLNAVNPVQASDVAERIFSRCDGILIDAERQIKLTVDLDAIQLAPDLGTPDQPEIAYDVPIICQAALPLAWPTVATPIIIEADGNITLTCATAGAAIYYTLDGSRPGPANGTLYTAPFTPGSGLRLRVRAGRWGAIASPVAELNPTS